MDTPITDLENILPALESLPLSELERIYTSLSGYETTPVDIETFIDHPDYLGGCFEEDDDGIRFFPYWREFLKQVYPSPLYSPYYMVVLRGCLAGDTKISTLHGHFTIEEIVKRFEGGESFEVLSFNTSTKSFEPDKVTAAFTTGVQRVFAIELDNGEIIKATSNHKFLSRNNKWVSIDSGLEVGTSLYPYRYDEFTKYHRYYNPETGAWVKRYREVAKYKTMCSGMHVHHKNYDKLDDRPRNLCVLSKQAHIGFHAKKGGLRFKEYMNQFTPEEYSIMTRPYTAKGNHLLWNDPAYAPSRKKHSRALRKHMLTSGQAQRMGRLGGEAVGWKNLTSYNKSEKGRNESRRRAAHMRELLKKKSPEEKQLVSLKQRLGTLKRYYSMDSAIYQETLSKIREVDPNYNHSVVAIYEIGTMPVYDLTTERNHNFILSSGIIAHNSIGQGKTVALCIGLAYQMYKLLCFTNPQKSIGLLPTDKVRFAIFNATIHLAHDVVLDRLTSFFTRSPYFSSMLDSNVSFTSSRKKKKKSDTLFPKGVDLFAGSRMGHSLGKAVFAAAIDEANFDVIGDQFFANLNSLFARMESRFMGKGGGFPGQIWIASSETDKASNLNKLLDQYRNKGGVVVSSAPIWKVKPHKYVLNKTFPVFIGSETQQPCVIDASNQHLLTSQPDRILDVPEEHRDRFEADPNAALRDLGGIATSSAYKFFRLKEKILSSLQMLPLFPDVVRVDFFDDDDTLEKHCTNPGYFANPIQKHMPRYLSIDISYAEDGDKLGVSASYIGGWKEVKVRDAHTLKEASASSPIVHTDFAFSIASKAGQQIPIYKVRTFLLWLTQQGYIITKVTADSASGMSADFIQQVTKMGYETELVSVDKTIIPYVSFRSAMYEDRWRGPANNLLKAELEELEITPDAKKIDHLKKTPGSNIVGSKDVSDSVCQGVSTLQKDASKFMMLAAVSQEQSMPKLVSQEIVDMFWGNPGQ